VQVQNKPLVIAGDEGCGKTALVSHWLTHSPLFQQKHGKHLVLLVHVAGASSCERKYQSFIHRALVKLRRTFPDVQTRLVHIIDDKLRINFSRCLDLVSNAIGQTTNAGNIAPAGDGDTDRDSGHNKDGRIIMILDGLENFRDRENDQGVDSEQSADWVPW
jgi:GTPase SAR1 family protein